MPHNVLQVIQCDHVSHRSRYTKKEIELNQHAYIPIIQDIDFSDLYNLRSRIDCCRTLMHLVFDQANGNKTGCQKCTEDGLSRQCSKLAACIAQSTSNLVVAVISGCQAGDVHYSVRERTKSHVTMYHIHYRPTYINSFVYHQSVRLAHCCGYVTPRDFVAAISR